MVYRGVADVVHLHLLGATSESWVVSGDQVFVATHLGAAANKSKGLRLLTIPILYKFALTTTVLFHFEGPFDRKRSRNEKGLPYTLKKKFEAFYSWQIRPLLSRHNRMIESVHD